MNYALYPKLEDLQSDYLERLQNFKKSLEEDFAERGDLEAVKEFCELLTRWMNAEDFKNNSKFAEILSVLSSVENEFTFYPIYYFIKALIIPEVNAAIKKERKYLLEKYYENSLGVRLVHESYNVLEMIADTEVPHQNPRYSSEYWKFLDNAEQALDDNQLVFGLLKAVVQNPYKFINLLYQEHYSEIYND